MPVETRPRLCECGCGEPTNEYRGQPRRFKRGHANKGKSLGPRPAEVRARISEAKRGVPVPPERAERIRQTMLERGIRPVAWASAMSPAATKGGLVGEARSNWKTEEELGYSGLHCWVRRKRPYTGICQVCGATECRTENANLSGEYRRDLDDFMEMCVPCHKEYDANR